MVLLVELVLSTGAAKNCSPLSPLSADNKVNLSTIHGIGLNPYGQTENQFLKEEKEKAVQGRVHNQVCHRDGNIKAETELHVHEEALGVGRRVRPCWG